MYRIHVDRQHAIIELTLDGLIRQNEMTKLVEELKAATRGLAGREIKIGADMRSFLPASPEVAEQLRSVQQFGLQHGVTRVAEVVESQLAALQLNRVARESGTDKILRRFADQVSSRQWLLLDEPEALLD